MVIEQAGRTESAPTARNLWGIGGLILLFGVLHLAWLLLKPADENLNRAIDNVAQFAGPLLALPLCLLGRQLPWRRRTAPSSTRLRPSPRADWAPLLLGMAILCETIGQIIWTYYEEVRKVASPFPSWADAVYLTLYPFLFLGIVLLPAEPVPGAARLRAALDGLMIMAVTATFSWFFLRGSALT